MSTIDWSSVNLKELTADSRQQLGDLCHKFGRFDNFLIQVVLLTVMVHYLALIYNAERAMDLAHVTNKCNGAPATNIVQQCEIVIWAGRVGFGLTALMLLMLRMLDSFNVQGASIFQAVFGIISMIIFIVCLSCASIAKGKISECTATQPPNQVGNPLGELDSVLGYMINWSAVGMSATLLYSIFYIYRAVTKKVISSATVGEVASQAAEAASSAASRAASTFVELESSSQASTAPSTPSSP